MGETVVIFMAGLGVLLLLGLNGNAGRWEAKVNGLDMCSRTRPQARILASPDDTPDMEPEVEPEDVPKKKRGRPKKTASKKTSGKPSKSGTTS